MGLSGQEPFVVEVDALFPTKWDQSRWQFWFNVDLAVREVELSIIGYGGRNGNLICSERSLHVPMQGWSEAFYRYTSLLWTQLELQLEPDR